LNTIVCTGSPATPEIFSWFYREVKPDVWVAPLCGGTDVAAPFIGGMPILPMYAGEMQAPCLGVDVQAFNDTGAPVVGEVGELVVTQPMPSMPLYFWNDPDNARYIDSYFSVYPGVWRHGDLMKITSRHTFVVYGRSDSTLNRHGVRIGTSEIYRALESIGEIEDSLIINLELSGGRFFMPLFVKLRDGAELDDALRQRINAQLRAACSPRHVPDKIYRIDAVPYTLTGKKQEVPVKRILLGAPPEKAVNPNAMANPQSIDYFVRFARESADYQL
jgi:acetoacetyl-CoA synthetase